MLLLAAAEGERPNSTGDDITNRGGDGSGGGGGSPATRIWADEKPDREAMVGQPVPERLVAPAPVAGVEALAAQTAVIQEVPITAG